MEHGNRFYHQKCYDVRYSEIESRKNLIDYICRLQNLKQPTGYILKQIKDFQETRGYTLRGMLTTLKYVHEVEEMPVLEGVGIGIIEYFYEKAILYHTNLYNIRKTNSIQEIDNKVEVIYAIPQKTRKKKLIDIEDI